MDFGSHVDIQMIQTPPSWEGYHPFLNPDTSVIRQMPTLNIRTVMLEQLREHHLMTQRRRFQERVASALSDISSLRDSSDSMSVVADSDASHSAGSLISIDTPDISDGFMDTDNPATSESSSDSVSTGMSDFETDYYISWERRYRKLLHMIQNTRVLYPAPPIPKCSQLHLLDHWRVHSPERFCRKLRVDPETFDCLVTQIKDHPIFHNNSNNSQLPVHIQLCIFLFRAGHYGNSSSPEDAAQWSGVSVGAVEKSTDRVVISLLSHHDEAIHFPDAIEKEQSKAYVEEAVCPEWRDGFLLADGTKFPFYQRPGLHGDAWYDKDGAYSIDCQVLLIYYCFYENNKYSSSLQCLIT